MDARFQEMLDHYEITKTLKVYCHGCDRCDEPRMRSVYANNSWDDHGPVKATGPEFARIMTGVMLTQTHGVYHLLGQSQISVDGDAAGAETYFIAICREPGEHGVEVLRQLGGRFVDKLLRVDGRWQIEHRTVVADWSISTPIKEDWDAARAMVQGERSDADPSYAALGLTHGGAPSP